MSSHASQSSNSGWLGGEPWVPKSLSVSTSPRPNSACQIRLTTTRGRQRIAAVDKPLCQVQPVGSRARALVRKGVENRGNAGRHGLTLAREVAAQMDVRHAGTVYSFARRPSW